MCRIPPPEKNKWVPIRVHSRYWLILNLQCESPLFLKSIGNSRPRMLKSFIIILNHSYQIWGASTHPPHSTTFIRWDQLVSSLTTDAISVQCDGVNAMAFCHLQRQPLLSSSFIQIIKDELPRAAFGFGWFWNVSELHISSSTFAARYGYRQSFQQKSKSCLTGSVDRCLGELSQGARLSIELQSQALKRRDWTP